MNLSTAKVLFAHCISFFAHRQPVFSPHTLYLTNAPDQHPQVIQLPRGIHFDVAELVRNLPGGWYPDLFVVVVDAFFYIVPHNLAGLNCPKVLLMGDSHHGQQPLQRLIHYARSEPYDFYITLHDRHHLWYYWLAGLPNLYWLPSLLLRPPELGFEQRSFSTPQITPDTFRNQPTFIGQVSQFHPRRQRLLKTLTEQVPHFVWTQLEPGDLAKAFSQAGVALNISLNGDVNLRNFEVTAAQGCLLTDQLSNESGLNQLLTEGEAYEGFRTVPELLEKISYFSQSPEATQSYRRRGYQDYLRNCTPQGMLEALERLLSGLDIDDRFTLKSINRVRYCQETHYSEARIEIYQILQRLHQYWEFLHVALDAQFTQTSVVDVLDLPRVHVTVLNASLDYQQSLQSYLAVSHNRDRVRFLTPEITSDQVLGATNDRDFWRSFNVIISSVWIPAFFQRFDDRPLSREPGVIVSKDLTAQSQVQDFVKERGDRLQYRDYPQGDGESFFLVEQGATPILDAYAPSHPSQTQESQAFPDARAEAAPQSPATESGGSRASGSLNSGLLNIDAFDLVLFPFRDVNLIVFPDWQREEAVVLAELGTLIQRLSQSPNPQQFTLFIACGSLDRTEVEWHLSELVLHLLLGEQVMEDHLPELYPIGTLTPTQWEFVVSRLHYRVQISHENQAMIGAIGAIHLPIVREE